MLLIIYENELVLKVNEFQITEYSKNGGALCKLTYYLVTATKYQHKCINNDIHTRLREIAENPFYKIE